MEPKVSMLNEERMVMDACKEFASIVNELKGGVEL